MVYIVAALIFIAYLFGRLLSKVIKEEIKPGKRYFLTLQRFILVVISLTLLYISWLDFWVILTFFIGIISSFIIKERYFYFGMIVVITSLISKEMLLIYAFLMLVYSISFGTLNKGIKLRLLFYLLPFLLLSFKFVPSYHYLFLSYVSGALIFKE